MITPSLSLLNELTEGDFGIKIFKWVIRVIRERMNLQNGLL